MHQTEYLKNAGLKTTLPRLKVLSLFETIEERQKKAAPDRLQKNGSA
jgi:Fe2+ or Zn2+ uptake regulation protein